MKKLFFSFLQKALNSYLALDPESKQRLAALNGKTITIEYIGLAFTCQLHFHADDIQIIDTDFLTPDTIIKGTPLRMMQMALTAPDKRKPFFADDIRIEGDLELGQHLIALFDQIDIDWEEYLSHGLGDTPTYHLGRLTRRITQWGRQTKNSFTRQINEYLHEEIQFVPQREALNHFYAAVDVLHMDVDRLEARVQRIIQNRGHA